MFSLCLHAAVQCMLLFLVQAVNSDRFQILQSYMLLLKPPVLMCFWRSKIREVKYIQHQQLLHYSNTFKTWGRGQKMQGCLLSQLNLLACEAIDIGGGKKIETECYETGLAY